MLGGLPGFCLYAALSSSPLSTTPEGFQIWSIGMKLPQGLKFEERHCPVADVWSGVQTMCSLSPQIRPWQEATAHAPQYDHGA